MITEHLYSTELADQEAGYIKWLKTLNYSPSTVRSRQRSIREFLLYMERNRVNKVNELSQYKAERFVRYLKRRQNKKYGSGLSAASINVGVAAANSFFRYLYESGKYSLPERLTYLDNNYRQKQVLTVKEIDQLYEATQVKNLNVKPKNKDMEIALQMRDRAMLAVYYGCGLRKSEGTALKWPDIQIEKKMLFVREGKGSKQRNVPLTEGSLRCLNEYLQWGRKILLQRAPELKFTDRFFINQYGESCGDISLSLRLKLLVKKTGNSMLQAKNPSLHTLRHSIATHLLQKGMEIEMIQQMLGHSSLISTQVYTHIKEEL